MSVLATYVAVGALAVAMTYGVVRLRLPRWGNWVLAGVLFAASAGIAVASGSWGMGPSWVDAVRIGLAAVAGATAGMGIRRERSGVAAAAG